MTLTTSSACRDDLAKLQVRVTDTLAGFDEILKSAEPDIKPLMTEFFKTHKRHEAELSARLRTHGCVPDEDGSFFSTVQRIVIKTRAAFDEIDDDILGAVVNGEKRILDLYDEALSSAEDDTDREMLIRQRDEVADLTEQARQLDD